MDIATERSYPTPLSNSTLLPLLLLSLSRQKYIPRTATTIKDEYDYIVVGGGAAGSVVAARLSEIPSMTVLLLEAGQEPPMLTEVPALGRYFQNTDLDWRFQTVPQKYTGSALINRQIGWNTGKMLGGSGSFNGLMYIRGNRRDYNDWEALGGTGWSYRDVFKYFLKLENNTEIQYLLNGYHAFGGPVTVESPRYQPDVKGAVHEAATNMGYAFVDPNAATQTGFYEHQSFIRDNQRCSSVKSYLVPAENRTNLDIVTNAFVTKILIQDGRATGVQFDYKGDRREVGARKEVIVSAGTVLSPKILMLSGIGPREELEKFNIPVLADLPVGKNFQDHGGSSIYFTVDPRIRPFDERIADLDSIQQYIDNRSGPLALYEVAGSAFLKDLEVCPIVDSPTFQLYVAEYPIAIIQSISLRPEVYDQYVKPYENETIYSCAAQQLLTKSRGTVTLKSADPYDPPLIDPNFLEDPGDLDAVVQGLKVCRKLINSEALGKLGAKEFETLLPGCEKFAENEDEYFECFARSLLLTFHHAVGTTSMGDPADDTTVLDPQLRVKNIKGLRVVDGSIAPQLVSGNTNIPFVMIAEKASDMIKETMADILLDSPAPPECL